MVLTSVKTGEKEVPLGEENPFGLPGKVRLPSEKDPYPLSSERGLQPLLSHSSLKITVLGERVATP